MRNYIVFTQIFTMPCKCIQARIALYFDVEEGKIEDLFDIIYREYYMVARKYEIYFECEQDM